MHYSIESTGGKANFLRAMMATDSNERMIERELLHKYFRGETSEAEEKEIMDWAESSPGHYQEYLREREVWNALLIHAGMPIRHRVLHLVGRLSRRLVPYAAAVAAIALVLAGIHFYRQGENSRQGMPQPDLATLTEPTLLDEGEQITLTDGSFTLARRQADIRNNAGRGVLSYRSKADGGDEVKTSHLLVPRGKTYRLQLSDGTTVTLNADSELSFPTRFAGSRRTVQLKGEAYFEVAKDARRPFVVQTGDMDVRVLGTSFNVCCYADQPSTRTTLVQGAVSIERAGESIRIRPNEQYEYNRESNQSSVREVDTELYTSWVHNEYIFRNATLEEIFTQLNRWYDIDVHYASDDVRLSHFSFRINREVSIDKLLQLLNNTDQVCIERTNHSIYIKKK